MTGAAWPCYIGGVEPTRHHLDVLEERGIEERWVERTIAGPDRIEDRPDGTRHFLKQIQEREGRWLRVVVSVKDAPNRIVTAFFDRRERREP